MRRIAGCADIDIQLACGNLRGLALNRTVTVDRQNHIHGRAGCARKLACFAANRIGFVHRAGAAACAALEIRCNIVTRYTIAIVIAVAKRRRCHAGCRADRTCCQAIRFFKLLILQSLIIMNLAHNRAPDAQMGVICIYNLLLTVIPHPDTGGIVRRIAIEGQVNGIIGGTCFTCNIHAADGCLRTGTLRDNITHHIRQQEGGCFLQHPMCFLFGIIQKHVAVMVIHHAIEHRLIIGAAVGNGCIGRRLLQNGNALCQTAECRCCRLIPFINRGKAKVQQILISRIRADHHKGLNRQHVHGMPDTLTHCSRPDIFAVPVFGRPAAVGNRLINDDGAGHQQSRINRGGIRRQGLHRRALLTQCLCRTVEY